MELQVDTTKQAAAGKGPRAPSLQQLAFYAHDHFGEDGDPFAVNCPSSFEVVMGVYASYANHVDEDMLPLYAGVFLRQRLRFARSGSCERRSVVDVFVEDALTFLRLRHPDPAVVREHRGTLSILFRAHLAEARLGRIVTPQPEVVASERLAVCPRPSFRRRHRTSLNSLGTA